MRNKILNFIKLQSPLIDTCTTRDTRVYFGYCGVTDFIASENVQVPLRQRLLFDNKPLK